MLEELKEPTVICDEAFQPLMATHRQAILMIMMSSQQTKDLL